MRDGCSTESPLSRSSKQMTFKNHTSEFTLSCSGLSPANDTGAKKKKKKQKKKKEKASETESAQDQPVKVTRRLCSLWLFPEQSVWGNVEAAPPDAAAGRERSQC